jgi:rRNA-processing protein FCF1
MPPFTDFFASIWAFFTALDPTLFAIGCGIIAVVLWRLGDNPYDQEARVILVDGSNVMFWRDNEPDLSPLKEVIQQITAKGYDAGVVFDANVGYKLDGKFRGNVPMARKLGLKAAQVVVVDKGEPADRTILHVARDLNARILSNDRFRDWQDSFPEVIEPGRIVRGGYRNGQIWIDPI